MPSINFNFAFRGSSGAPAPLRIPALLAGAAAVAGLLQFSLCMAVNVRQLHLLNKQVRKITAPALGDTDPAIAQDSARAGNAPAGRASQAYCGDLELP